MSRPDESVNGAGWTTSLGLLAGIRANESAAWERFVALYGVLLDHWFRLARFPEADWADLRQDVFLAVNRGILGFRHTPETGSFRGWLRVIVRNKLIDRSRRPLPFPNSPTLDHLQAVDPGEPEPPVEYQLLFRRALELIQTDFEPATWQAFWLVAVEDRSPADAAEELGLTLNAVYLAKARVLRRLRDEFADFLSDRPPAEPP